jgi:cell division topological specificity factor
MIDFFRTLFRPAAPSGATAKERLRLVLLSDHLSLAPDVVEALKRDLLEVISRYVEIDSDHADVTFEHREREVAMLASIPIRGVRERRSEPPGPPAPPREAVSEAVPPAAPAAAAPEAEFEEHPEPAAAPATAKVAAATSANAARPRRRRRKKPAAPGSAVRPMPPPGIGQPAAQA